MTRGSFRQAAIERILRAAKKVESTVQIDILTLLLTVYPPKEDTIDPVNGFEPDSKDNWDD